jgi:CBS domain containing-hemolysin-like protein
MDVPLSLAAVLLLVAANGFFVATEFSLVAVRRTRVEQLAAGGSGRARSALDALNHLDSYIAATQLGITMASLALGWIGEPAVAHLIEPFILLMPFVPAEARAVASHTVSVALAFAFITGLHIVLGELAPKSLALQRAEATALFVARPIHIFLFAFRWPITALNWVGNKVVSVFGIRPAAGHTLVQSAEELKLSIAASTEAGLVSAAAQEIVQRALDFGEMSAHHVMVPRTEMIALPRHAPLHEVIASIEEHQHSRYPIYEGTTDNIVGVVSAKRLLRAVSMTGEPGHLLDLREYASPPWFVPEAAPAYRLLAQMKQERSHFAIVVNEYGETAGLVTLRDLMERIAGEVPDESEGSIPEWLWLPDGSAQVDGLMLVSDVERELGVSIGHSEYDTIGGFLFGQIGRRPEVGDAVDVGEYVLEVSKLDGLRIETLRVRRTASVQAGD